MHSRGDHNSIARPTIVTLIAALALAAVTWSGCENAEEQDAGTTATGPAVSLSDVERFGRGMPDGYPVLVESPKEMAGVSDLVVRGTIAGFDQGPIYYGESAGDPGAVSSTIMRIDVQEVLSGTLPRDSKDVVWVELFGMDPESANQTGPLGQPALLYLKQLPESGSVDPGVPVSDLNAGRPADQPSFTPARAQGFMVEVGTDVVQPAMQSVFKDSGLEDFAPDRERFPAPSSATEQEQAE